MCVCMYVCMYLDAVMRLGEICVRPLAKLCPLHLGTDGCGQPEHKPSLLDLDMGTTLGTLYIPSMYW